MFRNNTLIEACTDKRLDMVDKILTEGADSVKYIEIARVYPNFEIVLDSVTKIAILPISN